MARVYDSRGAKRRMLRAAVDLFLEKGYHATQTKEIYTAAGTTNGTFFNSFGSKEGVLYELVVYMFDNQFEKARAMVGDGASPALMYAMETAIQLAMTENSEHLRDLYVEAYSLQSTSEYIYEKTAAELYRIFGPYNPTFSEADFYEMEIASGGIMRGYMSVPCNMYFTFERKLTRFLNVAFDMYHVPKEEKQQSIERILNADLKRIAAQIIEKLSAELRENFACEA
ncbi:MAG: TetR/AcrR family transcriptional regulator [Clostridia bacterium]|nr:TetR/AcrR family transcriptional regulator [Clostridia bacterium]